MYALNLAEDNHILSASFETEYTPPEQPRVETLPDGDISDYRYEDGEYVYDPVIEPETYELAARRYNVGDLIENGSELYEVISVIPAGSKLIPGSNVKRITLEEYINKKIEEGAV